MKKRAASMKDRESKSAGLKHVCYLHEKRNFHDDFILNDHLGPGRPLFRICVQKHISRTHRFPVLPVDATGSVGFSRSEAKRPRSDV